MTSIDPHKDTDSQSRCTYSISIEGLEAIKKYIDKERTVDLESKGIHSPALFLSSSTNGNDDRLSPWSINQIWNDVFDHAGIEGKKTPHSARHAMGKYIIDKTDNLAAVQRQFGHKCDSKKLLR